MLKTEPASTAPIHDLKLISNDFLALISNVKFCLPGSPGEADPRIAWRDRSSEVTP